MRNQMKWPEMTKLISLETPSPKAVKANVKSGSYQRHQIFLPKNNVHNSLTSKQQNGFMNRN